MKKFIGYLLMFGLAIAMSACSKNLSISNDPDAPNEFERIQLRLTGNIMYMTPDTRVDDDGFENGDGIGVYISIGALKDRGNKVNNVEYTYKATNTEITDTTLIAQLNNLETAQSSSSKVTNIIQENSDLPFDYTYSEPNTE